VFDFSNLNPKPSTAAIRQKLETFVRSRWACHEDDHVLIQELNCMEPDCPPKETMIAIFSDGKQPIQFRIHKALSDVEWSDLNALFEES
jgi:hypothetical protein